VSPTPARERGDEVVQPYVHDVTIGTSSESLKTMMLEVRREP
jgi:hypothetical protein